MKHTVLVVEDEDKLRRVLELQLSSAGFDVLKAGSAEDGLKLAGEADDHPDRPVAAEHDGDRDDPGAAPPESRIRR